MELLLLNEWMNQWKQQRKETLLDLIQLEKDINEAIKTQSTLLISGYTNVGLKENEVYIPSARQYCYLKISPNYRLVEYIDRNKTQESVVCTYNIRGFEVEHTRTGRAPFDATQKMLNILGYSASDYSLVYQIKRTSQWVEDKAEKDMQRHKKQIEAKVEKICGTEITHVTETDGEIIVKGSNNKIARIFAIRAGGYNIQCLHIRVLVKEVK